MSKFNMTVRVGEEVISELPHYCEVVASHGNEAPDADRDVQVFWPSSKKWIDMGVEFDKCMRAGADQFWMREWEGGAIRLAYYRDIIGSRRYSGRKMWFACGSVILKFDLDQVLTFDDPLLGELIARLPAKMRVDNTLYSFMTAWSIMVKEEMYWTTRPEIVSLPDITISYSYEWVPNEKIEGHTISEIYNAIRLLDCGCPLVCACDDVVQSQAILVQPGVLKVDTIVSSPASSESDDESSASSEISDIVIVNDVHEVRDLKPTDLFIHVDVGSEEYLELVNFDRQFLYTPASVSRFVQDIVGDIMDCSDDVVKFNLLRIIQERTERGFGGNMRCKMFMNLFLDVVVNALDIRRVDEVIYPPHGSFVAGCVPVKTCPRKVYQGFCSLALFDDDNHGVLRYLMKPLESIVRLKRFAMVYPLVSSRLWLYAFDTGCGVVFHIQREDSEILLGYADKWYDTPERIIQQMQRIYGDMSGESVLDTHMDTLISLSPMHVTIGFNHVVLLAVVTVFYRSLESNVELLCDFKAVVSGIHRNIFEYLPVELPYGTFKRVMIDNYNVNVLPLLESCFPFMISVLADPRYVCYLVRRYKKWGFSFDKASVVLNGAIRSYLRN